ncbi:hypothetical protein GHT06_019162 [Daphnia sinensis]|uniref:K Homology domain-containing protein n=1 Tax=Daphnia sinensis TaxID=1820382 RepID=A0AAD5PP18_9CRUS|nr:hypothetical protein GHT06_019162 [Daphnia sinensis]
MEFTTASFFLVGVSILLWDFFVHKTHEVPDDKPRGLPNASRKANGADKSAKRQVKRDRRKRKKLQIAKPSGIPEQDLTPNVDAPINAGQTEDDGGNLSPPFDTCEIDRDASCSSKLAKEPLVAAAGLPNVTQKANDADKSAKRQVKRDRRKRKRLQITKPSGIPEQDLTPNVDAPINTGQTEDDGGNLSPPFDTCEIDRDASCSSKLAKEPQQVAVANEESHATDLSSTTVETRDIGEKSNSLPSNSCKMDQDMPHLTKLEPVLLPGENDGCITTLRYISRSEIPRIAGKGGRITKLLERKHGVKIDLPQGDNGNIVISGANETTRRAVEACIRDRLIMTITLPNVDAQTRVAIRQLVDLRKLKILDESNQGSVTFTGLTRDCKVVLNVPKCF